MSRDTFTITARRWSAGSMPIAISISPARWISTISIATAAQERWLDRIDAPMLLLGIRSDWLYPAAGVLRACTTMIVAAGKDVNYFELDSPDGHDAFLKEWDMLTQSIGPFVSASLDELDAIESHIACEG